MRTLAIAATLAAGIFPLSATTEPTFGERLGWKADDRILILHNDDVGMSHESNVGTIEGFEAGLMNSSSTMMPCSWVLEWRDYLLEHPEIDNGLHLTLTSEWKHYRWRPVAGASVVPGLVDDEGYMHRRVMETITNATADEVEIEIRAQIALAEKMGLPITHLDSHMGTLFYSKSFFERYIKVGIEKQIPIMIPSGRGEAKTEAEKMLQPQIRAAANAVWDGGLPVLDYLITSTADTGDANEMTEALKQRIRDLEPGITQIILHGTRPGCNFHAISSSGKKRNAELEMVLSDEVKQLIKDEGIIMTTYRELMKRRQAVN